MPGYTVASVADTYYVKHGDKIVIEVGIDSATAAQLATVLNTLPSVVLFTTFYIHTAQKAVNLLYSKGYVMRQMVVTPYDGAFYYTLWLEAENPHE